MEEQQDFVSHHKENFSFHPARGQEKLWLTLHFYDLIKTLLLAIVQICARNIWGMYPTYY